jgi:hypothetical protein
VVVLRAATRLTDVGADDNHRKTIVARNRNGTIDPGSCNAVLPHYLNLWRVLLGLPGFVVGAT